MPGGLAVAQRPTGRHARVDGRARGWPCSADDLKFVAGRAQGAAGRCAALGAALHLLDDLVGGLLQLAAKGGMAEHLAQIITKTGPVTLPGGLTVAPTKDNLQKVGSL